MRRSEDIEYVIIDGKPSCKEDDFVDGYEIEVLEVEFEATPRWEDDGIGDYEYWGCKGNNSDPYVSCEYHGITWDKTKYSDLENVMIEEWLINNFERLENRFCEEFTSPDY
jgi:hypothetical protein